VKIISHFLLAILFVFLGYKNNTINAAYKGWFVMQIDGDDIKVSCSAVFKPVAVRYAWSGNPKVAFFNLEGIPASSFLTHNFEN